ncbi:hypothetical protein DPX16_13996 [Anabarilius grahami]|uniref:Uncharacterized protein n=1 Tax=Anabarilius grahami TaxID=495550 RepID=A0A3N0Y8N3_ANAGA|nr:hypothetical protein DPX16_13996 [Anabarilius grahami]
MLFRVRIVAAPALPFSPSLADQWSICIAPQEHAPYFTVEFCRLADRSPYDDEMLKSLYWIRVNFHHPIDLPDTQGLCLREAVVRCLESVYPRSIQPPQPNPEPSPSPLLRSTDLTPEPPADWKLPPAATCEPEPEEGRTGPAIALEPKHPGESDLGCEQATQSIAVGVLVEFEGMEVSHAHPPATESEYQLDLLDIFQEPGELDPCYLMNSPVYLSSPSVKLTPPPLPLPPPLLTAVGSALSFIGFCSSFYARPQPSVTDTTQSSLSPTSPSVSPPLSGVVPPWTSEEPIPPGRSEPVTPPPASECSDSPRPVALVPAPALLPPSTPALTFGHSTSPGSRGPSAQPGSDLATPPLQTCGLSAALRPSTPSAPASSAFPQSSPTPSVIPARSQPSGSSLPSRGVIAAAQSRSPGSSALLRSFGSSSVRGALLPAAEHLSIVTRMMPRKSPPWPR